MKKCEDCDLPRGSCHAPKPNEAQLWKNMVDNMLEFTKTSSALIKNVQGKLNVPPDFNKINCDPCGLLKQLQNQLTGMNVKEPVKPSVECKCTSPIETEEKSSSNDDYLTTGINYYQPPMVIKKKKYKYSSDIECKIMLHRKRLTNPCHCTGKGEKQIVDGCLCDKTLENCECDEDTPFNVCSGLSVAEIKNFKCFSIQEKEDSEAMASSSDDPIEGILKPGYDPDKLPQNDSNPLILKGEDEIPIPENLLGYEIYQAMKQFGDKISEIHHDSGEERTYQDLLKKSTFLAQKLRKETSKDDIIGVCSSNHKNRSIPYLAALFNGNRVVSYNRLLKEDEIIECIKNVTPKIMFVSTDSMQYINNAMSKSQITFKIMEYGNEDTNTEFCSCTKGNDNDVGNFEPNKEGSLDSTAIICFTCGTTGMPKAVCLSHFSILGQCLLAIQYKNIFDIILNFTEISNILCVLVLISAILCGVTRIIAEDFTKVNIWKLIEHYKIRSLYIYPQQFMELSNYPEPEEDISSLFWVVTAGERMSINILKRLRLLIMSPVIFQMYLQTETGIVTTYRIIKCDEHAIMQFMPYTCGKPMGGVSYKIISLDTGNILDHSCTGELYVKSKFIMNGYFVNNKEQPIDKTEWFRTGDLLFYDNYECFHFVGRTSEIIKCRNKTIFPSKIEDILMSDSAVDIAIVRGIPHPEDGEQLMALVKLNGKMCSYIKELEKLIEEKLPEEERLKGGIKIMNRIPYSSCGRIRRSAKFGR